jgi:hypothetical protein
VHDRDAERIVLVMDNLNTHRLSVLYQVFSPEEARRLYERFEVHHTPKHASWLNMAECELSVLSRQCLDRRIDSQPRLASEVTAWNTARNAQQVRVDWQFTTPDGAHQTQTPLPRASTHRSKADGPLDLKQAILLVVLCAGLGARRGGRTGGPWLLRAELWLLHAAPRGESSTC